MEGVMLDQWFFSHPREVGESYVEHQGVALSFSFRLFGAAAACFVHALVPGVFQRTGSTMVKRLHDEMVKNRVRRPVERDVETSYAAFDVGL